MLPEYKYIQGLPDLDILAMKTFASVHTSCDLVVLNAFVGNPVIHKFLCPGLRVSYELLRSASRFRLETALKG